MCITLRNANAQQSIFSLQWHITAKCDQKCKHCYMYDSETFKNEYENQLSFDDCKKVLDDFASTLQNLNTTGGLYFTGGDPLLREDFFDILAYAKSKGNFMTAIMGNPFHVDINTATKLKEYGVMYYQISIDGMKETHDFFRKPGSFDASLRAFDILNEAGITPVCMFTVSKLNMHELIDVIRMVSEHNVGAFAFDRLVPVGCGKDLKNQLIPPNEYKELLLKVKDEYQCLRNAGSKTIFAYKDTLWGLLIGVDEKMEILNTLPEGTEFSHGCSIGDAGLCILSDGNAMACRRLPIIVGKVPEQKLLDIFQNSSVLINLRNMSKVEECGSCDKFQSCRGCRAVAYGESGGNYFARDPQCWYLPR